MKWLKIISLLLALVTLLSLVVRVGAALGESFEPSISAGSSSGECKHDYSVKTVNATCTDEGERVYTCQLCSYSYAEIIPARGHFWEGTFCQRCGKEMLPSDEEDEGELVPSHIYYGYYGSSWNTFELPATVAAYNAAAVCYSCRSVHFIDTECTEAMSWSSNCPVTGERICYEGGYFNLLDDSSSGLPSNNPEAGDGVDNGNTKTYYGCQDGYTWEKLELDVALFDCYDGVAPCYACGQAHFYNESSVTLTGNLTCPVTGQKLTFNASDQSFVKE